MREQCYRNLKKLFGVGVVLAALGGWSPPVAAITPPPSPPLGIPSSAAQIPAMAHMESSSILVPENVPASPVKEWVAPDLILGSQTPDMCDFAMGGDGVPEGADQVMAWLLANAPNEVFYPPTTGRMLEIASVAEQGCEMACRGHRGWSRV